MKSAIIYVRYSTKRQEVGASRDRQLELCRAIIARNGWAEVGLVEDLGVSAWKGDHLRSGGLGKLAALWSREGVPADTVLVVERLDRLSREEPRIAQRWLEDRCADGLTIATSDGAIYTNQSLQHDLSQILTILIRSATSAEESNKKSDRVNDAKLRAFKQAQRREGGWVISKKVPGWLELKPDKDGFIVNDERAQVVRDIYEMSASGTGAPGIASELNRRGVLAWGAWRKDHATATWDTSYVKNLLTHPAVEGDYLVGAGSQRLEKPHLQGRINGYFPRIVDADLVERARAAVAVRKVSRGRQGEGIANLFAGLIKCHVCGSNCYVGWSSRGARYVRCDGAARRRGCTNGRTYNYQAFEASAVSDILHLAVDDNFFASTETTADLSRSLAEARKAVEDRKTQRTNLVTVLSKLPDNEEVILQVDALSKDIRSLQETVAGLEAEWSRARGSLSAGEQAARIAEIKDVMTSSDPEVRRAARYRVQQALKGIVDFVALTRPMPFLDRGFYISLVGGKYSILYDNSGVKRQELDETLADLNGEGATHARLEAFERRLKDTEYPLGRDPERWTLVNKENDAAMLRCTTLCQIEDIRFGVFGHPVKKPGFW